MLRQYGVEVKYLSDLVRAFALKQGNTKNTNFIKNLMFAEWAWKELFRKSIWEIKQVVRDVCPKTGTIKLPEDCERLVNISVLDRFGRQQPLSFNPALNTVEILCQKNKCSCVKCGGKDTLCAALDNVSMTTSSVVIGDASYTATTWVKYGGNGDLQRQTRLPVLDSTTSTVTYQDKIETICNLEMTDQGCIAITQPNAEALRTFCGFGFSLNNGFNGGLLWDVNPYANNIPLPFNFFGYWNWNAASRDIIHIFHNKAKNALFVNDPDQDQCQETNGISQVIIAYQTNGENAGEELLVPAYAEMAVNAGMLYQQAFFNPRDRDKSGAGLRDFTREKMKVMKYLNPIRMDDVRKMQTQLRRW